MSGVPELFGSLVFNDAVMKERLPKDTYNALKKTMKDGKSLDRTVANVVALSLIHISRMDPQQLIKRTHTLSGVRSFW